MAFVFNPLTKNFNIRSAAVTYTTNRVYIDCNNGNNNNVGGPSTPFLTAQAALDSVGSAANSTVYNAAATAFYEFIFAPGTYTENLTIPCRQVIHLNLGDALISGNVSYAVLGSTLLTGAVTKTKLIISGNDSRSYYNGSGYPLTGISGNLTITNTSSTNIIVDLQRTGIGGNIVAANTAGAYAGLLFIDQCIVVGTISTQSGCQWSAYIRDCDASGSKAIGSVSGQVLLNVLNNVNFVSTVVCNAGSLSGAKWSGVKFAAVANDFTSHTLSVACDFQSFDSLKANCSGLGSVTATVPNLRGTITNDSAAALMIGEFNSVNSPTGGTSTVAASTSFANVTSQSLTAGDWDVEGVVVLSTSGTTATYMIASISSSTAAQDALNVGGVASTSSIPDTGTTYLSTGRRRISLAATTTVYLVAAVTYSVAGTQSYTSSSFLRARRVR